MKSATIRVGVKGAPAQTHPVRIAENLEDMNVLAKSSLGVIIRCFNRGFRIESQERSGARDAVREGKANEEVAALIAGYDPTAVRPRGEGRPRKPAEVKLTKGKKSYTPDELAALLAASGIKANISVAE